jgi:hypothetical protein
VCPVEKKAIFENRESNQALVRSASENFGLKRGITGVYHHVSQQHLKRYLAEFDFRYNERIALGVDDTERAAKALRGVAGKRLTYRQPASRKAGQPETNA